MTVYDPGLPADEMDAVMFTVVEEVGMVVSQLPKRKSEIYEARRNVTPRNVYCVQHHSNYRKLYSFLKIDGYNTLINEAGPE